MNKIIKRLKRTANNNLQNYEDIFLWIENSVKYIKRELNLSNNGFSKIPINIIVLKIDEELELNSSLTEDEINFLQKQKELFEELEKEKQSCNDLYSQLDFLKKYIYQLLNNYKNTLINYK